MSTIEDGWRTKETLSGFRGVLGFSAALIRPYLTFRWILAPGWKNKADARSELARLVSEYSGYRYQDWSKHVGQRKDFEFTAPSGISYRASIEPDLELDGDPIAVGFTLRDGGIGAYFPLSHSILVEKT